ncbi:FUSC family protein (plasmid) [Cupriavidus basilensis]
MLNRLKRALTPLLAPYRRYRQARVFHGARVALALLLSVALTTGVRIPHGEWASITVLVVIGGLQHHGNIRRRAAERGVGTLMGALVGLLLIAQQSYFDLPVLTYILMAVACGYCAYHAIGKGSYLALLTAVTIVIAAGHGTNEISEGIWRTANVLIGTAIALVFSFALPAYATYSWRTHLAVLLRACADVHAGIALGRMIPTAQQRHMIRLGSELIQLRSLIPSVAKECQVSITELEEIQRSLRVCISALELLASIRPPAIGIEGQGAMHFLLDRENRHIANRLDSIAASLERGHGVVALTPAHRRGDYESGLVSAQLGGYVSLTMLFTDEIDLLSHQLSVLAGRTWLYAGGDAGIAGS